MAYHRVRPGTRIRLGRIDPADTGKHADEAAARAKLGQDIARLAKLQDVLYAERRHAVLVVLQGMDTSGKDGTVKHVMSGVNPSGCEVVPFKVPIEEEAAHDFLWRAHRAAPRRGHITIFNRSHYEDVLVPRVHRTVPRVVVRRRYALINDFERLLAENGTLIVKFFLHISKGEQRRRLAERLADPDKAWKFSANDLKERALWERYVTAYEKLFDLFEQHAARSREAAALLGKVLHDGVDPEEQAARVKVVEHQGDEITHTVIERLHQTFITPIDRGDIHELISRMDDVLDLIEASAERIALYGIRTMEPEARELGDVLEKSVEEMEAAVRTVGDLKNRPRLLAHCTEINRLENVGDQLLRRAVARLFRESPDPIHVIKWKEIYDYLENAIDRCEDVANVIEGVALEYA